MTPRLVVALKSCHQWRKISYRKSKNNMSRLAIVLSFLAPSLAFGQDLQTNVTDITYNLEDEVPGLGIKVDISEWVAEDQLSKLAQEICEGVAPEVLPQLAKRNDLAAPTFIEVDAKVPRSFGIVSVNIGQVRRFSYNDDGTCAPLWVDD